MKRRQRLDGAETVVFVCAAAVIAALLVWWGVFARRLILEVAALQEALAREQSADVVALKVTLESIGDRASRQLVMIAAEGLFFAVMLLVCVAALFIVARQRRLASERLVRLLQFTTHELKTPIAGVRALLQSLQIGSVPPEARARLIDQGLLETNRLEHLAETILAFQRARAQNKLKPMPASKNELLDDVLEHRRRTMASEMLERVRSDDVSILVDKDAFRVVLENLLDNARKYGGGHVTITDDVEGHFWRLSLHDRGIGFEPGDAERLFAPFERDASVSTHGSGLGLYISRQLVRDMGGKLWAMSEGKGRGATFILELPIARGASHG